MGAIQQAFNQALNIGAIVASPMIAEQKKIRKAEKGAELASEHRLELATKKPKVEEAILDEAFEKERKAHERSYEAKPTAKKAEYLGVLRGEAEDYAAEDAAKKAANEVYRQSQIYKDQQALIQSVKEASKKPDYPIRSKEVK